MSKRILIVDDDQELTMLFRLILRRLDVELEIVTSGERALQSIRERRPLLVLLDLMLPNMDGAEVCRRLRAEPDTKDLPVIIVSARLDAPSVAQAVGATDCLRKPFSAPALVQCVQAALRDAQARKLDTLTVPATAPWGQDTCPSPEHPSGVCPPLRGGGPLGVMGVGLSS